MILVALLSGCAAQRADISSDDEDSLWIVGEKIENTVFEDSDISIQLYENSLSADGASFIITNSSKTDYGTVQEYRLGILVDETWFYIKSTQNYDYAGEEQLVSANSKASRSIVWTNIYGKLPKGKYCYIDYFHPTNEPLDQSKVIRAYCFFEITEEMESQK